MLDDSDIKKRTKIRRLQHEIRTCRIKLFSMIALAIMPLIVVLAGVVASAPHTVGASGESSWFLTELSTGSIVLVLVIWTVPLLLIIKAHYTRMGADKVSLFKLQQEFSEEPF